LIKHGIKNLGKSASILQELKIVDSTDDGYSVLNPDNYDSVKYAVINSFHGPGCCSCSRLFR